MSFNDDVQLDTSQVEAGGGGGGLGGGGMLLGGGLGGGGLLLVVILSLLGVIDPSSLLGGGGGAAQPGQSPGPAVSSTCRTGADANRDVRCRVVGTVNSVQDFWADELPRHGVRYSPARTTLYSGQTQSSCGTASNAVGPFYCPTDRRVYIDASFFDELTTRFGADDGALAQEYVVAHEYGHHVQDLLGVLGAAQADAQGATSGSVRVELQADCYAGMWARGAASTQDARGRTYLKPLTRQDIASALSAASAVGDDRIQSQAGGRADPESYTHGTSAQRQRWFTVGYQYGDLDRCDTLHASSL
jgi:predicted metalloprotease